MLAKVQTYALLGIDAYGVTIECDISNGLPQFTIVGLPDNAVKESRERIRSALKHSGLMLPDQRITINLAPANTKKEGAIFDLPIALSILVASNVIEPHRLANISSIGELSLDGSVKSVPGILPMALHAARNKATSFIVPSDNSACAKLVEGIEIKVVSSLKECVDALNELAPFTSTISSPPAIMPPIEVIDFADVKGQMAVKRGLEIAASGGHNAIIIGPPGSGKTMLARCIPSILPPMNYQESLSLTHINSAFPEKGNPQGLITHRPFRSPHHSSSSVALIGGGSQVRPGEVTLAHHGVLFLDELPEFSRHTLEVLRQPLEEGFVTIARAKASVRFPAQFMLIASMNPCPCGQLGNPHQVCRCSSLDIQRYQYKISDPLLDRIDMRLQAPALMADDLYTPQPIVENSATIKQRCIQARHIQHERFKNTLFNCNANLSHKAIKKFCLLDDDCQSLLKKAMTKFNFSVRSHDRIIKVARTIADLDGKDDIEVAHIAEAIGYRALDRK